MLPLDEFFKNADLINEGSSFRSFFKRCVSAGNPVAIYLESLRIAAQTGELTIALGMLISMQEESD